MRFLKVGDVVTVVEHLIGPRFAVANEDGARFTLLALAPPDLGYRYVVTNLGENGWVELGESRLYPPVTVLGPSAVD